MEKNISKYEDLIADMDKVLVGCSDFKNTLRKQVEAFDLGTHKCPGHYIFAGNQGTGKSEAVKLLAKIFKEYGLLKRGHIVEVRKSDLIGQNVGETSIKTKKKCEEALDGILFVDEAYDLVNCEPIGEKFRSPFDEEAYTEILTQMDVHQDRLCVVFAGYPMHMGKFFFANSNMQSKVTSVVIFPDFPIYELFEIFKKIVSDCKFSLTAGAESRVRNYITKIVINDGRSFGNGRAMRNLFDECKDKIIKRYRMNGGKLQNGEIIDPYVITEEDIPDGAGINFSATTSASSFHGNARQNERVLYRILGLLGENVDFGKICGMTDFYLEGKPMVTGKDFVTVARKFGYDVKGYNREISESMIPCVLHMQFDYYSSFIVLEKINASGAQIYEPNVGMIEVTNDFLRQRYAGVMIKFLR